MFFLFSGLCYNEQDLNLNTRIMFTLPEPLFDPNGFGDFLSKETFEYHHGKHHAGYVKKLNAAIEGTELAELTLEEVIEKSRGTNAGVFNNAAQHFNHSFFWNCLSPETKPIPKNLADQLAKDFDSVENFLVIFSNAASALFGSGWVWLVKRSDGKLDVRKASNSETPVGRGDTPLLTLDVWEHAYYIDHRNSRPDFIKLFWDHVNWDFVAEQLG